MSDGERRQAERRKDWKPPAYQHYAKEWLVDTAHLSLEEQGAYQRYLDHQWVNGKLPDDERDRARILGVTVITYRRVWRRISGYFPAGLNPRLEEVRRDQEDYREKKARAGQLRHSKPPAEPQQTGSTTPAQAPADGQQEGQQNAALQSATCSLQSAPVLPKSTSLVALRATDAIVQRLQEVGDKTLQRLTEEERQGVRAEIVFAYWAKRLGHEKTLLDNKRRRTLLARLTENGGDVSELLYVVDGALRDDWTMGRDAKSTRKYDGIETIFQDRAHVEKFANLCPGWRQGAVHPMAAKYAA